MLDSEIYDDTTLRLRTLKSQLPESAVSALAGEVLKRLARFGTEPVVPTGRVNALAMALVDPDKDLCLEMILDLKADGHSVETLYLDYLGAAARRLGEHWMSDRLSFSEVSMGTARIYGLIRALDIPIALTNASGHPTALFVSVPGEAHTLGVRMAADLFRRRGWEIDLVMGLDHDDLLEAFDASSHVLVGTSAAGVEGFPALARLIVALRTHRPGIRVMVSGNLVDEIPDRVAGLSPDGMAADFDTAVETMNGLWADVSRPRA